MFIRHITLTTGHTRDSQSREVPQAIRATLAPLVQGLNAAGPAGLPMPGFPGYRVAGKVSARCLVATVHRGDAVLASIGVAGHSRCGAVLWRGLHDWGDTPVATDRGQPPAAPWVAAALDAAGLTDPAVHWLGDFERCLAWAFVDPNGGA